MQIRRHCKYFWACIKHFPLQFGERKFLPIKFEAPISQIHRICIHIVHKGLHSELHSKCFTGEQDCVIGNQVCHSGIQHIQCPIGSIRISILCKERGARSSRKVVQHNSALIRDVQSTMFQCCNTFLDPPYQGQIERSCDMRCSGIYIP